MRELFVLDKKDYDEKANHFQRSSVRGIIIHKGKLAMIHNMKYDFYVFPGGGIETGESHCETLIREVAEEAGLQVKPETIREFGSVRTLQKGLFEDILDQTNYYYMCEVEDEVNEPNLEEYEKDELFQLEFINPKMAIDRNQQISMEAIDPVMPERERMVLEVLCNKGMFFG